jgi:hypothetical protein
MEDKILREFDLSYQYGVSRPLLHNPIHLETVQWALEGNC